MMIDSRLEFSDAQAVTTTAVSTNVIDLGQDRNIGRGRPVYVVLTVDVAVGGTTPTFDIDLETDDNEGFASAAVIASYPQITDVNGLEGAQFVFTVPYNNEQYLRLNYTSGGTTPTGTFSAHLTDQEPQSWESLPDAVN